jgi:putative transposase
MTDWHHAPMHRLEEDGAYMVTGAVYQKKSLLKDDRRLALVHDSLLELADHYGWSLQAWAVLANHYHFVATAQEGADTLAALIRHLHSVTARELNRLDSTEGRRVWFQYWDTRISYETSYLARLKYVHHNPAKHGLVGEATQYRWCSARWFEMNAPP